MGTLIDFGVKILEALFFIGMAGSAIVVCISFIEDIRILFEE